VYDEATDTYKPRFGRGSVNDPNEVWIMPDNPEELKRFGAEDPFILQKMKKRERVELNKKQQVKNLKRAQSVESASLPPTLDITKNAPKRQKYSLEKAVSLIQVSTASMGKFDPILPNEPTRKVGSHALPTQIPKELAATSKIAERVLKKSTGLNIEKAVRSEMRSQQGKSKSKGSTKKTNKKPPPRKSNKKGGKKANKNKSVKKHKPGVILTK